MILTKAEYIASIQALLPDNSTQEISPLDLRTSLINLSDSVHLFLADKNLSSLNFDTPDTRTTKGGDFALSSMFLAGRSSVDNSAFGYASLRQNYDGSGNTAVGAFSQSCNLYGYANTAVGFQSVAGNVTGSHNVGVGNYTLNNNRNGDYNIALGHAAGWYLGPDDSNFLCIASHPVQAEDFCDVDGNPLYTGDAPLIYGNLDASNHQLAIGTNVLHNYGMLQVSGDISPTTSGEFKVGNSRYPLANINDEIYFSGSIVGIGGMPSGAAQGITDARMTLYGDLVPSESGRFAVGHPELTWDGYFNDVVISGQLKANDVEYNTVSECLYECKTLHLATSGFCDPEDEGFHNSAVCGFLSDSDLDGAGLEVHSSGTGYQRDYRFIYKQPDQTLECLPKDNSFSRSRWEANTSMELTSGNAFIGDRLLGRRSTSVAIQSGCMGMFVQPVSESGQMITFTQAEHIGQTYEGLADANFISRSGTDIVEGSPSGYNYGVTYGTVDSGVKVAQNFFSRIGSAEGAKGFRIIYHDERDSDGGIDCGLLGYNDLGVEPVTVPID
ncbi:hypothetical protein OAK92_01795 [Crocinitomicaceae bacterium]|nr:hypothetical protein [Crocinitomicaceae bacterium]